MHRERVQHLVREDDAMDRCECPRVRGPAQIATGERGGLLLPQPRRDFDDRGAGALRRIGPLALERTEHVA